MWNKLTEAGIIPPVNPNNDKIRARFFPSEAPSAAQFEATQ